MNKKIKYTKIECQPEGDFKLKNEGEEKKEDDLMNLI